MNKSIPTFLWIAVIAAFIGLGLIRIRQLSQPEAKDSTTDDPPGRYLEEVAWKHFPDVPPFQMVNQAGEAFDSRLLHGKPYLVSFFFTRCPVTCRQINARIKDLNQLLRNVDMAFVSVSVDPENDSPAVLQRYSEDFDAQPDRWFMLTDQRYKVVELGEQIFGVLISENPMDHTHTEDFLLVDKWGRYRDRFRWDDRDDIRRMLRVLEEVAAETSPPIDQEFRTRNLLIDRTPEKGRVFSWMREFRLRENGRTPFYSRDLTGSVWVAQFLPSDDDDLANRVIEQTSDFLAGFPPDSNIKAAIQPRRCFITGDSSTTPTTISVLEKEWLQQSISNGDMVALFGEPNYVRRIGSEFFGVATTDRNTFFTLFVFDRWHRIRGRFDVRQAEQWGLMKKLIEELMLESEPLPSAPSPQNARKFLNAEDED